MLALACIGIDSVDVNSVHRIGMATWQLGKTGIGGIGIGSIVIASIDGIGSIGGGIEDKKATLTGLAWSHYTSTGMGSTGMGGIGMGSTGMGGVGMGSTGMGGIGMGSTGMGMGSPEVT